MVRLESTAYVFATTLCTTPLDYLTVSFVYNNNY